jgi:antitoxin component HigA of HigAB toxin-antitoxin module
MQSVKPLANETEYDLALKDIDRYWDASKGSPEYNRLETLIILVEEYEAKHWPVAPPDSTGLGEWAERLQSLVASVEVNLDGTLSADEPD